MTDQLEDSSPFTRVNTRVTRVFKNRLKQAVENLQRGKPGRVTEGDVLVMLGEHLPPCPSEDIEVVHRNGGTRKKPVARERKRRVPKTASAGG